MQEAWEENVEIWAESVSDNHMTNVSENDLTTENTLSGNEIRSDEKEVVYTTVDESYFDDAVFIGDSRTFRNFHTDFYAIFDFVL